MGIKAYFETQGSTTFLPNKGELHLKRKMWHIFTGLSILILYYRFPQISLNFWIKFTFMLGSFVLLMDLIRIKWERFNLFVIRLFKHFLRDEEKLKISGLPFYALGCSASLFLFDEKFAILSILFLVFADPISSAIGILYGNHRLIQGKSIEGFFAGFITCNTITFFYLLYYLGPEPRIISFSLIAGLLGAFSELSSFLVDDNLSIPILSGVGLTVLNHLITVF